MAARIKVIAALYLLYGVYACLWAPILYFGLSTVVADPKFGELHISPRAPYLLPPAYVVLGLGALSAGFGLFRRKEWGRPIAILMALAALPILPQGTPFGVFALWALSSDPSRGAPRGAAT